MSMIPHVKEGDIISAADFNAVAEKLERCRNLRVAQNSGLTQSSGPWGHVLGLALPREIWAQLSGASSPYSWHQARAVAGGTWATYGNLAGTSNAYEINGRAGLNGKVVQLSKTSAGDWRFSAECINCACAPGTAQICATAADGCSPSNAVQGATITVKQGATVIGTCTTDASGQCCVAITTSGTYTVTCSVPGGSTLTNTVNATCTTNNTTFTYATGSFANAGCDVSGCPFGNNGVQGATCSLSISGTTLYTAVTDSTGHASFGRIPATSYTLTVTHPRWTTYTTSAGWSTSGCASASAQVNLGVSSSPASGYACMCPGCEEPAPTTLHLTDSVVGSTTLTYNGATGNWEGSIAYSFPGDPGNSCPASTVTVQYSFNCSLTITYPAFTVTGCPSNAGNGSVPGTYSAGVGCSIPYSGSASYSGAALGNQNRLYLLGTGQTVTFSVSE